MKKILSFMVLVLFLSGCAGVSSLSDLSQTVGLGDTGSTSIVFIDAAVFDQSLSNQLTTKSQKVEVVNARPYLLSQIPDRMGKWLSAVVNAKGKLSVEPKPEFKTLALDWVIGLLPTGRDMVQDQFLYSPAKDYNVTLFHNQSSGMVERIVFEKKTAAATSPASLFPTAPSLGTPSMNQSNGSK
jgi:hypothetical protein